MLERRVQQAGRRSFVEQDAIGGKQRGDAVARAQFDALDNVGIQKRLAQADQHHVLGRAGGFRNEALEDGRRHVRFGLPDTRPGAHWAVEVAPGCGFDNVLDRQAVEFGVPPKVGPESLRPVPGAHGVFPPF